jgi:bisphosphoglycerate-independent phosphoglycerate mutase (AlkP superfamily)
MFAPQLVTADHGNCEVMVDYITGEPHTAHTLNLVPVALVRWRLTDSLTLSLTD